jgi:tetratricopeptide (TPR) repeat protein
VPSFKDKFMTIRPLWLCAGFVLLTACSNSEQAKKEHFDNAARFMAAGRTQEAIVEYRNALQEDPRFGEARLKLAEAYEAAGSANQAYREFVRAADLLPQNDTAQVKAASYLIAAGSFEDARTRIQPVIQRNPTNLDAQLVLGNALVGLKDLDGAVREIEEAIKLEPGRALTYSNLASVKLAQGQKDEAKAAFEKAVSVDPRSVRARLALAFFQWSTGDFVAAEDSLKKALEVEPTNQLANRTLAALYMGSNRAPQAEPYFKRLAASGVSQASLQLADYYMRVERLADARAVLEPLKQDQGAFADAETRLAAIAYRSNDKARAHTILDGVLQKQPNNIMALVVKTGWLAGEGKAQEAVVYGQRAVKGDPNSTEAHFVLGSVYDGLKQRKQAIAEFNEVLRLNPRAAAAQMHLSRLNLLEGSAESAVTFAEGAVSNAPGNPNARLGLVRALLARRDAARAEQELAPLVKQYPNEPVVLASTGTLRLLKGDAAGARAFYERAVAVGPKSIEALAGLTSLDIREKKTAQARERVERRLATEPDRADLLMLAAQVYRADRDFPKAEAALRRAIQKDAGASTAYTMLAGVLVASGKLDAARAEFDQMVARDSSNVGAATMAAMIVQSQSKTADARKRYETIVSANPTAAVAANNLAWIYAEEGDKLDEALRLAQGAAARLPDSAEVQDTIGWIYYKKELPALAISAFEKSVEQAPDNALYHFHLAAALNKAGDARRAREAAQQAVKLRPNYPEAQRLLTEIKG